MFSIYCCCCSNLQSVAFERQLQQNLCLSSNFVAGPNINRKPNRPSTLNFIKSHPILAFAIQWQYIINLYSCCCYDCYCERFSSQIRCCFFVWFVVVFSFVNVCVNFSVLCLNVNTFGQLLEPQHQIFTPSLIKLVYILRFSNIGNSRRCFFFSKKNPPRIRYCEKIVNICRFIKHVFIALAYDVRQSYDTLHQSFTTPIYSG